MLAGPGVRSGVRVGVVGAVLGINSMSVKGRTGVRVAGTELDGDKGMVLV
ncbi:MAG: hypothetical protein ACP5JB_05045 [candidate division WOR-3 bacterium]